MKVTLVLDDTDNENVDVNITFDPPLTEENQNTPAAKAAYIMLLTAKDPIGDLVGMQ